MSSNKTGLNLIVLNWQAEDSQKITYVIIIHNYIITGIDSIFLHQLPSVFIAHCHGNSQVLKVITVIAV